MNTRKNLRKRWLWASIWAVGIGYFGCGKVNPTESALSGGFHTQQLTSCFSCGSGTTCKTGTTVDGCGKSSTTYSCETNDPGPPSNVSASNIGRTSLTLSWTKPANYGASFSFIVYDNYNNIVATTSGNSIDITGLKEDTNYSYTVQTKNAPSGTIPKTSALSNTVNVKTQTFLGISKVFNADPNQNLFSAWDIGIPDPAGAPLKRRIYWETNKITAPVGSYQIKVTGNYYSGNKQQVVNDAFVKMVPASELKTKTVNNKSISYFEFSLLRYDLNQNNSGDVLLPQQTYDVEVSAWSGNSLESPGTKVASVSNKFIEPPVSTNTMKFKYLNGEETGKNSSLFQLAIRSIQVPSSSVLSAINDNLQGTVTVRIECDTKGFWTCKGVDLNYETQIPQSSGIPQTTTSTVVTMNSDPAKPGQFAYTFQNLNNKDYTFIAKPKLKSSLPGIDLPDPVVTNTSIVSPSLYGAQGTTVQIPDIGISTPVRLGLTTNFFVPGFDNWSPTYDSTGASGPGIRNRAGNYSYVPSEGFPLTIDSANEPLDLLVSVNPKADEILNNLTIRFEDGGKEYPLSSLLLRKQTCTSGSCPDYAYYFALPSEYVKGWGDFTLKPKVYFSGILLNRSTNLINLNFSNGPRSLTDKLASTSLTAINNLALVKGPLAQDTGLSTKISGKSVSQSLIMASSAANAIKSIGTLDRSQFFVQPLQVPVGFKTQNVIDNNHFTIEADGFKVTAADAGGCSASTGNSFSPPIISSTPTIPSPGSNNAVGGGGCSTSSSSYNPSGSSTTTTTVSPTVLTDVNQTNYVTGLGAPTGVSVSPSGNVYIVESTSKKISIRPIGPTTGFGAGKTKSTLATAYDFANKKDSTGVALDGAPVRVFAYSDEEIWVTTTTSVYSITDKGVATKYKDAILSKPGEVLKVGNDVYIADTGNHRILKNGKVIVGNGKAGYSDGDASTAQLSSPQGFDIDSQGNLLIADTGNGRIRLFANGKLSSLSKGNLKSPTDVVMTNDNQFFVSDGTAVYTYKK